MHLVKTDNVPGCVLVAVAKLFASQNTDAFLWWTNTLDLTPPCPTFYLSCSQSLRNFLYCALHGACCCEIKSSDRLVWVIQGLGHSNKKCKMWDSVSSAVLHTQFAPFCKSPSWPTFNTVAGTAEIALKPGSHTLAPQEHLDSSFVLLIKILHA